MLLSSNKDNSDNFSDSVNSVFSSGILSNGINDQTRAMTQPIIVQNDTMTSIQINAVWGCFLVFAIMTGMKVIASSMPNIRNQIKNAIMSIVNLNSCLVLLYCMLWLSQRIKQDLLF